MTHPVYYPTTFRATILFCYVWSSIRYLDSKIKEYICVRPRVHDHRVPVVHDEPRSTGSVSWALGCHAGGREFDSGRTPVRTHESNSRCRTPSRTHDVMSTMHRLGSRGVKNNNRVESAAFVITLANGWTFKSSCIRTISRRSHLATLVVNICGYLFVKSRARSSPCCGLTFWDRSNWLTLLRYPCQKKITWQS